MYGGTPGCKACKGESATHSPVYQVRFNGLIRADKTAEARSKSLPPTPVRLPPTPAPPLAPAPLTPGPPVEPEVDPKDAESDRLSECAQSDDVTMVSHELFVPDEALLARDCQFRWSKPSCSNQNIE